MELDHTLMVVDLVFKYQMIWNHWAETKWGRYGWKYKQTDSGHFSIRNAQLS